MTLSGWFKNYVYIPLGGSRHGKVRMLFNMFVVWSLTGLWHGAGWNFILWGMFGQTVRQFGIYLVLAFIFSTAWPYGKYRENKNRPLTILILLVLFGLCVYKMQTAASNPFLYFRF